MAMRAILHDMVNVQIADRNIFRSIVVEKFDENSMTTQHKKRRTTVGDVKCLVKIKIGACAMWSSRVDCLVCTPWRAIGPGGENPPLDLNTTLVLTITP